MAMPNLWLEELGAGLSSRLELALSELRPVHCESAMDCVETKADRIAAPLVAKMLYFPQNFDWHYPIPQ